MIHRLEIIALLILAACSTAPREVEVMLEQDVMITRPGDSKPTPMKRGDLLKVAENSPSLVESPGHVPVLVLPTQTGTQSASLRLKPLGDVTAMPKDFWAGIDGLFEDVVQVQKLLRDRKGREALTLSDDLIARYPQVSKLRLLKASCLMVLGEKRAAMAVMQSMRKPAATDSLPEPQPTPPLDPTGTESPTPTPAGQLPSLSVPGGTP